MAHQDKQAVKATLACSMGLKAGHGRKKTKDEDIIDLKYYSSNVRPMI